MGLAQAQGASDLRKSGDLYEGRGEHAKALSQYEQALAIDQALKNRENEAFAFLRIGNLQRLLGKYAQALASCERSLAIYRELGQRAGEAAALGTLGLVQLNLGRFAAALASEEQALAIYREIHDRRGEGSSYTNIGLVYSNLGENRRALAYLEKALAIDRESGDRHGEAIALSNIAAVSTSLGRYSQALAQHEQALAIVREFGDRLAEQSVLGNLANLHEDLGDLKKSLQYHQSALDIARDLGDRVGEAAELGNMGNLFMATGQHARALTAYQQALALSREFGDRRGEANHLTNIGTAYRELGQPATALKWHQQALAVHREVGDRVGEAIDLSNLGIDSRKLGRYPAAIEYHQQALALFRRAGERAYAVGEHSNIGVVFAVRGEYDEARVYIRRALKQQRELGNRRGEGGSLSDLGMTYLLSGQYQRALDCFKQALPIVDEVGEAQPRWRVNLGMQRALVRLDRSREAVFFGKRAVNIIQDMRAGTATLQRTLQASFVDQKRYVYNELYGLLVDQGRLGEAQQVLRLLKEEEYFDFVRRDQQEGATTDAAFVGVETSLTQRYDEISGQLAAIGREYATLARIPNGERSVQQRERYISLQKDLDLAVARYRGFLDEIAHTFQQAGRAVTASRLAEIEGLQSTLEGLGEGTVLVHYLVTPQRLHILITTADIQIQRSSAITEVALNRLVAAYRQTLQNPHEDPLPQARALYQHLLAPIGEDLEQAGARVVMLSLDGTLRYLPFAALHDGQQWLIERYALSLYTDAASDKIGASPAPEWRIAGLGVSESARDFDALPAVPFELDGIVKEAREDDAAGVLPGQVRLDDSFTEQELRAAFEQRYPVVHIASHFRFAPGTDADSFLLLGNNVHLSLADLKNRFFRFGNVDLLTLSACQTAMGDAGGAGAEVEGLAVAVQRRGARSVLATLWSVADASTGLFMLTFYGRHQQEPSSKAEALRYTQLAFLNGTIELAAVPPALRGITAQPRAGIAAAASGNGRDSAPFAHPFYWAPFILMGNWR